ncbi:MAG TPA: hypothetical protein VMY37_40645, partial [Thermoguttaceae bacterium]|nr:hypothetical protein [Thermoguttaceae bacterium]
MSTIPLAVLALALAAGQAPPAGRYFQIEVVDAETGRGVPLVELRTVNNIRYYTDSGGIVAFDEPGLMGRRVFFYVESHGYEYPEDGFGFRGKALDVTPGGAAQLKIKRINVAERLYRVTGAGTYRDSLLTGHPVPIREPVLNGQVLGSDSVLSAVYQGKIHWFWGDTNRPGYPLGNFHVPGATSLLPDQGGLDPEVGVDLEYFVDAKGFAKETARVPGEGPTWLDGLTVLGDSAGRERLFARYVKVRKPMEVYEQGLVEFNAQKRAFEKVVEIGMDAPAVPEGHPLGHTVDGVEYVYFANPFPLVRVRADPEHFQDPASYEAFTCLRDGTRLDDVQLDRNPGGKLRYGWKKNTPPIRLNDQMKLVKQGRLTQEEALPHLCDVDKGKPIAAHRGSVYWNDYRRRWVMIATETFGDSMLGEVWYAEADAPEGPWGYARKIVTHQKYSFYNPKQHPMFDKAGGRIVFFEGTYTNTFSGNPDQTPRYNYNQVMYKLDLADPRLVLPVAVYRLTEDDGPDRFATADRFDRAGSRRVAFFAYDRRAEGTFPVYQAKTPAGATVLRGSPESLGR